jgi:tRNA uridine 5-carboxymethylaminomethyl modification enzyme
MFTSRAEHRLLFNHGSSEIRYLDILEKFPLLSETRKNAIKFKSKSIHKWIKCFDSEKIQGNDSYSDQIRKNTSFASFPKEFNELHQELKNEILYRIKYEGYLLREIRNVHKLRDSEKIKIPVDFSYKNIPGLKTECAEKLSMIKPETLGQASRIEGVDPSAISVLMIMIRKKKDSADIVNA